MLFFWKTLRTYYLDNANNYCQENSGKLTALYCTYEGNKEASAKGSCDTYRYACAMLNV